MNEFFKISTIYDVAAIFSFCVSVIHLFFFFKDRRNFVKCRLSLKFQFSQDGADYYCVFGEVINRGVSPVYLRTVTLCDSKKKPLFRAYSDGTRSDPCIAHNMSFSFKYPFYDLNKLFESRQTDKLNFLLACETQDGKSSRSKKLRVRKADISRSQDHG